MILDDYIEAKRRNGDEVDLPEETTKEPLADDDEEKKSILVKIHLGWIVFDSFMPVLLLMLDLSYGDFGNFSHTINMLSSFDCFLTVVIFHSVWCSVTSTMVDKSGKEPYDFLLCTCCKNFMAPIFHLIFMTVMALPLAYAIRTDSFTPWALLPAKIELFSYMIRTIVVTFAGLFYSSGCILKTDDSKKVAVVDDSN